MKKRVFLIIVFLLFFVCGNIFAQTAQNDNFDFRTYLLNTIQSFLQNFGKAQTSALVSQNLSIFKMTELVSNNLNENNNASIEFWTQANCSGKYAYVVPSGYKLISCTSGPAGSHGGCATCGMAKIVLMKAITSQTSTTTNTTPVNGACGYLNGKYSSNIDFVSSNNNLCSAGVLGSSGKDTGNGYWWWNCSGVNGGNGTGCKAYISQAINGVCGSANGTTTSGVPTANLCASGNADFGGATDRWEWTCVGSNGGTSVSCSANRTQLPANIINGTCGSANGVSVYIMPSTNLCGTGTPSVVTLTNLNSWIWTCTGSNGGAKVSCGAEKMIQGVCGAATQIAPVAPGVLLCSDGNASAVTGEGTTNNPWKWKCFGLNGGAAVSCSVTKTSSSGTADSCGSQATCCGSSRNVSSSAAPSSNLCANGSTLVGTVSAYGTNQWFWQCKNVTENITYGCYAPKSTSTSSLSAVNGICGTSNAQTLTYAPTNTSTNLCKMGTASAVTAGNTAWTWACSGSNGGTSAACAASKTVTNARPMPCGYKYGDADGDHVISYNDVVVAVKNVSTLPLTVIDVNGNQRGDFNDVIEIYNYSIGKINNFTVCK
ncbi:MAG: hypothetical protein WC520_02700 [Candidatus Paceibacterota bacterium]